MKHSALKLKQLAFGFLFMLVSTGSSFSQSSFSISDTLKTLSFPSNEFVFYTWVVMTNNTGSDLNLRWVRSYVSPLPSAWSTQAQILDSIYSPGTDSADFVLPAIAGYSDYALIFFYPNNTVGNCRAKLKIFDPLNPTDVASVVFHGITYSTTSIGSQLNINKIDMFPNPVNRSLHLKKAFDEIYNWTLFNSNNQLIEDGTLLPGKAKIEFKKLNPNGIYYLQLSDSKNIPTFMNKVIIQNSRQ